MAIQVIAGSAGLLKPERFLDLLQEDFDWAAENIPFFDADDSDLVTAYYYRWRVFKYAEPLMIPCSIARYTVNTPMALAVDMMLDLCSNMHLQASHLLFKQCTEIRVCQKLTA